MAANSSFSRQCRNLQISAKTEKMVFSVRFSMCSENQFFLEIKLDFCDKNMSNNDGQKNLKKNFSLGGHKDRHAQSAPPTPGGINVPIPQVL